VSTPKVTIGVITYNSGEFIKETLDSCLLQLTDEFDIEIFVSDDASKDNTVEIISAWMETHGHKFASHTFMAHPENLGAKNNSNFVLNNSQGIYLRTLEGDDVLVDQAITKLVRFVDSNPEMKFVFSNRLIFTDDISKAELGRQTSREFAEADAFHQYKMMLTGMEANGPTTFFHRQTIIDCGGRVGARNAGDLTTFINLTRQGVKLCLHEEPLLYYRKHPNSISAKGTPRWWATKYELKKFRNDNLLMDKLGILLKMYCHQDFLRAKRKYLGLSFWESLTLLFLQPLSRICKKLNLL